MKRISIFILPALLIPGLLCAQDAPSGPLVEITGEIVLPVPDLQMTTQMGKPLRLYQELTNAYITKVETADGEFALCAFPKYDKKGAATAWITKDKSVFFGMVVPSMAAGFTLHAGEELPVVGQTPRDWRVVLQRYDDRMIINLAKSHPGVIFRKPVVVKKEPTQQEKLEEELRKYRSPEGPTQEAAQAGEPGHPSFLNRFKQKEPAQTAKGRKIVIAKGEGNELTAEIDGEKIKPEAQEKGAEKPAEEKPAAPPETVPAGTAATEQIETDGPAERKPPESAAGETGLTGKIQWIAIAGLGGLLAVVVIVKIVQKKKASGFKMPAINIKKDKAGQSAEEKKKEGKEEKASIQEAPPPPEKKSEPAPASASDYFKGLANKVDFSGSLESFSLLDLVQFLNSTRETGDLHILDDAGEKKAELFFAKGEIIDAAFGKMRGVAAIFALVKKSKGSFAFFRKKESEAKRTIEMPTMTLLLEASKNMDEGPAAVPAPKPAPPPKPLSLKKKK